MILIQAKENPLWQTENKFILMAEKCIKIRSQYVCSAIYNTQSRKDRKTEEYGQEISGCKFKKRSRVALNRVGPLLANQGAKKVSFTACHSGKL